MKTETPNLIACSFCEGYGCIPYNSNLNPNAFPDVSTAICPHCGGTGNVVNSNNKNMNTNENSTTENGRGEAAGSADAPDFRSELCTLINKHSMENGSNTPDFILNQFLADVLMCFNKALRRRDDWYGGPVTQPATTPPNELNK